MKNWFGLIVSVLISQSVFAQSAATFDLFKAIKQNDFKRFEKALNQGADTDAEIREESPTTTAFIKAVVLNREAMVKAMIFRGANVNQHRPLDQFTPVMIAAKNNFASLVRVLISAGADINEVTIFNRTALQIAALHNALEAGKVLVAAPNMNVNNRNKMCAMAVAARQGHVDFVKLLVRQTGDKAPSSSCRLGAQEMAKANNHAEIYNLLR